MLRIHTAFFRTTFRPQPVSTTKTMPSSGKCRQAWRPMSTSGHGGKSSSNVEAKRAWRAGKMDPLNPPSFFWIRHLVFWIRHLVLSLGALAPGAQNGGCYLNPPLLGPGELPPGGPKATPYYSDCLTFAAVNSSQSQFYWYRSYWLSKCCICELQTVAVLLIP